MQRQQLSNRKKKNNKSNLLVHLNPKSIIQEQYHAMRANLQPKLNEKGIKTLVITSCEELEGKSTTAANLAIAFSEVGKKVLLIDADLREPTIHHSFMVSNNIGLSDILCERHSIKGSIQPSNVTNLDILTSGQVPSKPSELLGSQTMEEFIFKIREDYDLIIFDSPPTLTVADPIILANICDSVLLVVRSDANNSENVETTRDMLLNTKAYFHGAVLNGAFRNKRKKRRKV
ncbi:CpsD/CapB family tyrosine-protein kinase [Metabacillus litoralis]|uniref:CpsD/CapB family tyrosine-protein kinase n=1 Tax=Metabacillus litoralis TaxID=152268 RepID=UPI00203E46D4|nr:CpsD/CapB family tyrosine-protein kinase [Metabacillus litoralis]MCM3161747.1 CpsD/CapB family tyrosine-protein kinase [Metabacillus litoralis]